MAVAIALSSPSNAPMCRERNYNTNKNKRTTPDKLEFSKYARVAASTRITRNK